MIHDDHVSVKADKSTIFILGNGPSLATVDFETLSPFSTIGMNAAYRHWRKIGWRPTHYACLDHVVGLSHIDAIADLIQERSIKNFLLRGDLIEGLGEVAADPRVVNFDALRATERLLRPSAVTTGSHAALWAATEGYHKIVLLGIDGQYQARVEGATRRQGIELEITNQPSSNPNYFFDDYQQPGDRYNIPNPTPDLHIKTWRIAAARLHGKDVAIYNGNSNSSVRCFPFVNLDNLLSEGSNFQPADAPITKREIEHANTAGTPANGNHLLRLTQFCRSNWLSSLMPIALFFLIAFAIINMFDIEAGIAALLVLIALFLSAIWLVFLFTRDIVITHINWQHDKITSLEESMRDLSRRNKARPKGG